MNNITKISIEGIPGIGKTTLYEMLRKKFKNEIIDLSDDFVKRASKRKDIESEINTILTSKDSIFLNLGSSIGETYLLLARIAIRNNVTIKKGLILSDKSIDTLFSHQIPRLLEEGIFKTELEAFNWIYNSLKPFYKFPDITFYLKPKDLNNYLKKYDTDKKYCNTIRKIDAAYEFLYKRTFFKNRVHIIEIDNSTLAEDVFEIVINKLKSYFHE